MKRCMTLLLALLLAAGSALAAAAEPPREMPVQVKAKSALLMDADTGEILLAQNAHEKLFPASVTKIMTLLLVMEALDTGKIKKTDIVTTSKNAASKGGSQIWLKEGERMSVDDLLKAAAVYSANDACTLLGEYLAGSEEAFNVQLNERAAQLGMTNTHFDNCTGLDDTTDTHLTTAHDVALMSRELLRHEGIIAYTTIWMDTLRGGETELVNTNKLIRFFQGITGLKTGTTAKAGCCVSASAKRDGTHLIAVVMGSATSNDRFDGAKAMLNWGFANYETILPELDAALLAPVKVIGGVQESILPQLPQAKKLLLPKNSKREITQEADLALDVAAPVEQGQLLGHIYLKADGAIIGEYSLTAGEAVRRLTFRDLFFRLFASLAK